MLRRISITVAAILGFAVGYLIGYYNAQQEYPAQNPPTKPTIEQKQPSSHDDGNGPTALC